MCATDKKQLIEFLDALKVLARNLWPNGGLDYDIHEISGDVETAFERNRNDIYGQEIPNVYEQESQIGEFVEIFAQLMKHTIGAKSESLGFQLARLLSEPYRDPSLWFVSTWDDDTWALSVVNTNCETPHLLNMTFQYDYRHHSQRLSEASQLFALLDRIKGIGIKGHAPNLGSQFHNWMDRKRVAGRTDPATLKTRMDSKKGQSLIYRLMTQAMSKLISKKIGGN